MIRLGFRFRLGSVRAGGMDWWTSGERGRERERERIVCGRKREREGTGGGGGGLK
jgi:hypothetical protein